ncbi:spore protease YyaC [Wukongibacter sp. M2B1]|uniref:spore protease YyaC n=1 Tax=Wukongibacter sp. M2B1 TaxID=3088895 RepID=UPI003D7B26B1
MDRLLINMYDKKSIEHLTNHLRLLLKKNQKISVLCIGTDKIIPDSLGPMIGTILSEDLTRDDIKIIGTLESPLHALNMKKRIRIELDNDELVIAIDANKGNRVGEIQVLDQPISPGKGLFKNLPQVGHISIVGTTLERGELKNIYDHKIRLGDIYRMAKTISSSLSLAINDLKINE